MSRGLEMALFFVSFRFWADLQAEWLKIIDNLPKLLFLIVPPLLTR